MDIVCFRILVTVGKWILLIKNVRCSLEKMAQVFIRQRCRHIGFTDDFVTKRNNK